MVVVFAPLPELLLLLELLLSSPQLLPLVNVPCDDGDERFNGEHFLLSVLLHPLEVAKVTPLLGSGDADGDDDEDDGDNIADDVGECLLR